MYNIKQISDMPKIRSLRDFDCSEITSARLFKGESFSYQIAVYTDEERCFEIELKSEISKYITIYEVKNAVMDYCIPAKSDDLLAYEPGIMPDLLFPIEKQDNKFRLSNGAMSIWVYVALPEDIKSGFYDIDIVISEFNAKKGNELSTQKMTLKIEDITLSKQELIFTQWMHTDCIASVHNVPVYSEKHWELIDKYLCLATSLGINMILTPVITPPLDTEIGAERPCTQLVKISYENGVYTFDFSLLDRWIELCKKNKVKYYEISHLFSQWGIAYAPNIMVNEKGRDYYKFGWHTSFDSDEYKIFIQSFLPELCSYLKSKSIFENCYFHISDEPWKGLIPKYKYAYDLIKPIIGKAKIMDAISDIEFYDEGLIDIPVTATNHIGSFLKKNIDNQWAYYCCGQYEKESNRFLAMPSYRNRIIGLQLYKYDIKGFLHWGYNFYYSRLSHYEINPYITTSADKGFPSGDSFSVYPYRDDVLPSLRAFVFKKALEDISLCKMLEKYIGRDKTIEFIEKEAAMEISFDNYPRNDNFLPKLADKIRDKIIELRTISTLGD